LPGCSKKSAGGDDDDIIPPAKITDLKITGIGTTAVTLQWTAPGDDDTIGTVVEFDIRRSAAPINSSNFSSGTKINDIPSTAGPGDFQNLLVMNLVPGTEYFFAMKTGDEQLNWSDISNCVAATCLTDQIISFPDTALNRVVRARINKPNGDLYKSDFDSLQNFTAQNEHIINLNGLREFTNLNYCDLTGNKIEFLVQFQALTSLQFLALNSNDIKDIAPLSNLIYLQTLSLSFNPINDLSPLSILVNLTSLDVNATPARDYSPIGYLTDLENLYLGSDSLDNIDFMENLTRLKLIYCNGGTFSDISVLGNLTALEFVIITSAELNDISPLSALIGVKEFRLNNNNISDILPLVNNTGLGSGDIVNLTDNPLSAESINIHIPALQSRGVTVTY
jgi:internalin A